MTDSKKFVLGVDLDGVVADFAKGFKPIAAEWLGVPESSLTDDFSYGFPEWKLERCGEYDDVHRYAIKERGLFRDLLPIDGAPAVLRRLSAKEVRIRIITHRLFIPWFHREAIQQTTEWLEKYGIPYWDLCFMRDKAAVGADLYLEDSPGNIEALRADGCDTIVFRNSTNRHLDDPSAESWRELEEIINSRISKWSS